MIMTRISKKLTVILVFVLLIAMPCDTASAASYNRYGNARFGYSIKYPSFFKRSKPLPQNGDGITMAGKKATLIMYGGYNVVYGNGKAMRKYLKKWGTKMTAVKASKKSLYYESKKGKKITFCYTYFLSGGHISMELTCKKSKKKYFSKIVRKMMKSMRQNKEFD